MHFSTLRIASFPAFKYSILFAEKYSILFTEKYSILFTEKYSYVQLRLKGIKKEKKPWL